MPNLKSLSIKGIQITETQLSELSKALPNCAIHSEQAQHEQQDISFGGVTFASDVQDLDLSDMGIWDISALSNCQYITRLNLSGNSISDLSPLMNMPYLQWLDISNNNVSDLRPLMGITSLSFLNASGNAVNSTSALSMMTGLTTLYLCRRPGCKMRICPIYRDCRRSPPSISPITPVLPALQWIRSRAICPCAWLHIHP